MEHIRRTIEDLRLGALNKRLADFVPDKRYVEFQDPVYYGSNAAMLQDLRAEWVHTPPELMDLVRAVFKLARKRAIPLYVHTNYREPGLQRALMRQGVSQVSDGPHQRSCAVDIVHAHYHWEPPSAFWEWFGNLVKEVARAHGTKIEWGGDFRTLYDPAHVQLADWRDHKPIGNKRTPLQLPSGETVVWKRSPFSTGPSKPMVGGVDLYQVLETKGLSWKTWTINNSA